MSVLAASAGNISKENICEKTAEVEAAGLDIPCFLFCIISIGREITHLLWNMYEWHSYSKYLCNGNLNLTC